MCFFCLRSVVTEGPQTRQHRDVTRHRPHRQEPHACVRVPGKSLLFVRDTHTHTHTHTHTQLLFTPSAKTTHKGESVTCNQRTFVFFNDIRLSTLTFMRKLFKDSIGGHIFIR